ncbi:MAG: hypothetical protein RR746_05700 [Lachnospiraceae bacterium]
MKNNMKLKTKTIIMSAAIAIVLIVIGVGGFLFINHKLNQKEYKKQLVLADKYLSNDNYKAAIVAYQAAIKIDDKNKKAYENLAKLYISKNDYGQAKYILRQGIYKTKGGRLNDLLRKIQSGTYELAKVKEMNKESQDIILNVQNFQMMSDYTYEQYTKKYKESKVEQVSEDVIEMAYMGIDAVFIYDNSVQKKSVNVKKNRPYDDVKPTKIIFHNLNYIFKNYEETIDFSRLQVLFNNKINCYYNEESEQFLVDAEYEGSHLVIESDENGNILSPDAFNYMIPAEEKAVEKCPVSGNVIDATTGEGVQVHLVIDSVNKDKKTDKIKVESKNNGQYKVDLDIGKYTVEISAEGYITETFEIEVKSLNEQRETNFTISPKLHKKEIRIVLEWGETPKDLDSHLQCGNLGNLNFGNKTITNGQETVASLDLDDQDGYGPETTTIYKQDLDYSFNVKDYRRTGGMGASRATVKVYMFGNEPVIYTVPEGAGNLWCVFQIKNGKLIEINKMMQNSEAEE